MGNNYRFKLSDMMPNAWFFKLRDMGKSRKQTSTTTTTHSRKKKQPSTPTSSTKHSSKPKQPHQYNNPRKSYYFTRDLNLNHNTSPPNNQKVLNTTNFHEPQRKSTKQRAKRRTSKTFSPKYSLEVHDSEFRTDSVLLPTDESLLLFNEMVSLSNNNSSCGCRVLYSNNNNADYIIIDVDNNSIARRKDDKLEGCDDSFSGQLVLPPIVTKPSSTKFNDADDDNDDAKNNKKKDTKPRSRMVIHKEQKHNVKEESGLTAFADVNRRMDDFESRCMTLDQSNGSCHVTSSNVVNVCKSDRRESESIKGSLKVKIVKQDNATMKKLRNSPGGGGKRLRLRNSPRIRSQKSVSSVAAATEGRRSLSDSFAIVKSSFNPQRDFRESMVEMIVQNNIRSSKDLEDLLACYLSLNSDEYHDLIIKVFKEIWFDLTNNK